MWPREDHHSIAALARPALSTGLSGDEKRKSLVVGIPPAVAEYGFYLCIAYAALGEVLGVAVISGFGALLLAVVCALCLKSIGLRGIRIFLPISLLLAFTGCFIAVQVLVHNEGLLSSELRPYIPWVLTILTAQALMLRRGFLSRFAVACSAVGFIGLGFSKSWMDTGRIGLEDGVSFANPNALGFWFGFMAVYFAVSALETKKTWTRLLVGGLAGVSLMVVGMTVSRGALVTVAIALTVASRRLLKRGFLPLLALLVIGGAGFAASVFDSFIESYTERGLSSSGRLEVLAPAWQRLHNQPLIGYGVSNVKTFVPLRGDFKTPHNAFLAIGLAGGIVCLVPFISQLLFSGWQLIRWRTARIADAPFYLPLLVFILVALPFHNKSFMSAYSAVVLSAVSLPSVYTLLQKNLRRRMIRAKALELLAKKQLTVSRKPRLRADWTAR